MKWSTSGKSSAGDSERLFKVSDGGCAACWHQGSTERCFQHGLSQGVSLLSLDLQAHPGIIAASIPWLGGHDYKRLCTWFPYMGVILVLTRDKGSGRVTIGRDGLPRMHYWPNKHDQQSMMNVRALCSALCSRP